MCSYPRQYTKAEQSLEFAVGLNGTVVPEKVLGKVVYAARDDSYR
jgi:hypothetical protein